MSKTSFKSLVCFLGDKLIFKKGKKYYLFLLAAFALAMRSMLVLREVTLLFPGLYPLSGLVDAVQRISVIIFQFSLLPLNLVQLSNLHVTLIFS